VAAPAELPVAAAVATPTPTVIRIDPPASTPAAVKSIEGVPTTAGADADPAVIPPSSSPLAPAGAGSLRQSAVDEPAHTAAVTSVLPSATLAPHLLDLFFLEIWDQDQLLFPDSLPAIDDIAFPDALPAADDMPSPVSTTERHDSSLAGAALAFMQITLWANEDMSTTKNTKRSKKSNMKFWVGYSFTS
jgi:hypothetical protein